jgi:hypothetical protein
MLVVMKAQATPGAPSLASATWDTTEANQTCFWNAGLIS